MPIYGYKCNYCEAEFDMLRKVDERDNACNCPNCQSSDVKPLLSAPATTFKFADRTSFK